MRTNGVNNSTTAIGQATNLGSTTTAPESMPSASEGERSEHERVLGMDSGAHARTMVSTEVPAQAARRRFSAQYKLKILAQVDKCKNSSEVGALLRREGLYSSHLTKWRRQREEGALAGLEPQKRGRKQQEVNPLAREVARLQRENERLQTRLKQAETIIEVQKKISQLLSISLPENGGQN